MHFEREIQTLYDSAVDFVVIGWVAAVFHGSARATYDLDICYSGAAENLRRLVAALAPFHPRPRGFPPGLPFVWDERTLANAAVLILQTDLGELDLLAEVAGIGGYREVEARSLSVEAVGRKIRTLDLPGLIAAKRAAGRPRDRDALPELESLLESRE